MTNVPHDDPREIFTTRVIDWPPAQVFGAYADPAQLARWWGPAGFTNTFRSFDFQPGGHWHFTMHGPDGTDYPNHNVFHTVEPAERIVLEHVDVPHFIATVTFEAVGTGQTRLGFRMRFDDAAERDRVAGICIPANEQNIDRLCAVLGGTPPQ